MYYSHLLVPPDRNLVFDGASMTAFLEAVAKAGFVGENAERFVKLLPAPEGAFYWGMWRDMPKTGKYRGPNPASWVRPESEEELLEVLADPDNVGATVWSELRPRRLPLIEIEAMQEGKPVSMEDKQFDEVFYIAVTCWRMEAPVSMSDDGHYDGPASVTFGDPVEVDDFSSVAVANYPYKSGSIEVPGIAEARSWVSVTFGKYVFPPDHLFEDHFSKETGLAFAAPEFLALAERLLGCRFRQTCAWG
jgi:hypothetical protein